MGFAWLCYQAETLQVFNCLQMMLDRTRRTVVSSWYLLYVRYLSVQSSCSKQHCAIEAATSLKLGKFQELTDAVPEQQIRSRNHPQVLPAKP